MSSLDELFARHRIAPAPPAGPCRCGDSGCSDTFGKATRGQDRSGCCQYCGYFDCDVCGWSDPSGMTFTDYLRRDR